MRVLVGCEESQAITKAFRARGHEAYSCDLKDCSGGHPEWHIKGDFLVVVNHPETHISVEREGIDWDMVICHPPCTHIANSGARHFEKKRKDGSQKEAIEFFCKCINLDVPRLCVENPVNIISGDYIKKYYPDLCEKYGLPVKPTQVIQPYEYGNPSRKTTCLWLKGLPNLVPTNIVKPELITYTCKNGKKATFSKDYIVSGDRGTKRSKTYEGIAEAMAMQWGDGEYPKVERKGLLKHVRTE